MELRAALVEAIMGAVFVVWGIAGGVMVGPLQFIYVPSGVAWLLVARIHARHARERKARYDVVEDVFHKAHRARARHEQPWDALND